MLSKQICFSGYSAQDWLTPKRHTAGHAGLLYLLMGRIRSCWPFSHSAFLSAPQKCQEAFSWLNSSDVMFCIWCWFGFRVLLLLSAFALDEPKGFQWSTRAAFSTYYHTVG